MKKIWLKLMAMLILLSSIYSSASDIESPYTKNYVYDEEGNPAFIKVYMEYVQPLQEELSNQDQNDLHQLSRVQQILHKMSQKDQRGTYFVVPIKKKKSKTDDDDISTWECPYCGTVNLASNNTCSNENCPLYRKKGRNWHNN